MKVELKPNVTQLLTAILLHPDRVRELPFEAIPGMLAQLAATQSVLAAQLIEVSVMNSGTDRAAAGRLLNVEEAAQKLGVAPDWLYRRAAHLPFTVRLGRVLRFSEEGLDRWIRSRSGR